MLLFAVNIINMRFKIRAGGENLVIFITFAWFYHTLDHWLQILLMFICHMNFHAYFTFDDFIAIITFLLLMNSKKCLLRIFWSLKLWLHKEHEYILLSIWTLAACCFTWCWKWYVLLHWSHLHGLIFSCTDDMWSVSPRLAWNTFLQIGHWKFLIFLWR